MGDGLAHTGTLGGAMEAGTHAALHHQVLAAIEAGPALAVTVEADPAAAERIGRTRRKMLAGDWMLPGGIAGQLDHLKAAHRGLPAGTTYPHRKAAPFLAPLQHQQQALTPIEHQVGAAGRGCGTGRNRLGQDGLDKDWAAQQQQACPDGPGTQRAQPGQFRATRAHRKNQPGVFPGRHRAPPGPPPFGRRDGSPGQRAPAGRPAHRFQH